jgi:hypothetical protein
VKRKVGARSNDAHVEGEEGGGGRHALRQGRGFGVGMGTEAVKAAIDRHTSCEAGENRGVWSRGPVRAG